MAFIYKITNDINQKVYIGKTERGVEERFKEHCRDYLKRSCEKRPLYAAMKKYGPEHFHVELVEETDHPEEREQYWIKFYNSYGSTGYNATMGGDGKKYIDVNKLIEAYNRLGTVRAVSKETGHNESHISKLLRQAGIQIVYDHKKSKEKYSKRVVQCDKNTKQILHIFTSIINAAEYIYQMQISSSSIRGIASNIGHVCNGKRKTAYGFYWEFI